LYSAGVNKFKPFDFEDAFTKANKKMSVEQVRELVVK
jgi:hypothetical protein